MNTIEVQLGQRSYPIYIGPGLLADSALLAECSDAEQILVVSNETVAPLYLERVSGALTARDTHTLILPDGEQYKTVQSFSRIVDELVTAGFHRDACIVALGGGVIGDLAGFAAASYQRGIDFLQLPTSLLAQVDSSVGGKTAVNHPAAKNMIGAFHQPIAVIADTDTLATLPRRELASGLAEVIKYGLIQDAGFLAWIELHLPELIALDADALGFAIGRCCEIKAEIVAEDEHEHGQRAALNFGHTFGHAIESLGGYGKWLHGEAVAIGMQMAAEVSARLGSIDAADAERIEALLERAGLPTTASDIDANAIMSRMRIDKKAGKGGLRLVLLEKLGRAVIVPAPDAGIIRDAIERRLGVAQ